MNIAQIVDIAKMKAGLPARGTVVDWGEQMQAFALEELARLEGTPEEKRDAQWESAIDMLSLVLANALMVQGAFREAIEVLPDIPEADKHRVRFRELLDAYERDDDDLCDCEPPLVDAPEGKGKLQMPKHHLEGDYWTSRGWMRGLRCTVCGMLNLRAELTPEAARGLQARGAKSDRDAYRPVGCSPCQDA